MHWRQAVAENVVEHDHDTAHLQYVRYDGNGGQVLQVADPVEQDERDSEEAHIDPDIPDVLWRGVSIDHLLQVGTCEDEVDATKAELRQANEYVDDPSVQYFILL